MKGGLLDVSGARALAERLHKEKLKHADEAGSAELESAGEPAFDEHDDSSLGSQALPLRLGKGAAPRESVEPDNPGVSQPVSQATSAPKPERRPLVVDDRWNLLALDDLVMMSADRYPERMVEWRAFLSELEPYAEADGFLPGYFDSLVAEIFGDLVG